MIDMFAVLEAETPNVFGPFVVLVSLVGEQQEIDIVILLCSRD